MPGLLFSPLTLLTISSITASIKQNWREDTSLSHSTPLSACLLASASHFSGKRETTIWGHTMPPSELLFKIQKCRSAIFLTTLTCFFHIAVPALKKVQPKIQRLPSPQWAHLDTEIFQEVVIVCADNPHQLFIRHYKFSDR
jgi:hypothetical protein